MPKHANCLYCGKELEFWRRYDTKFCGQNCRKAYSRRRDKITRGRDATMSGLGQLRLVIKKHADLRPEAAEMLRYLRQEINDLLLLAGDKDAQQRTAMLNDRQNRRGGSVTTAMVTDQAEQERL